MTMKSEVLSKSLTRHLLNGMRLSAIRWLRLFAYAYPQSVSCRSLQRLGSPYGNSRTRTTIALAQQLFNNSAHGYPFSLLRRAMLMLSGVLLRERGLLKSSLFAAGMRTAGARLMRTLVDISENSILRVRAKQQTRAPEWAILLFCGLGIAAAQALLAPPLWTCVSPPVVVFRSLCAGLGALSAIGLIAFPDELKRTAAGSLVAGIINRCCKGG